MSKPDTKCLVIFIFTLFFTGDKKEINHKNLSPFVL